MEVESERLTDLGDGSAERCDFRKRRHEEVGEHGDGIHDAHEYLFRNAVQPRRNDDGQGRGHVDGLRHGSDAEARDDEEYGRIIDVFDVVVCSYVDIGKIEYDGGENKPVHHGNVMDLIGEQKDDERRKYDADILFVSGHGGKGFKIFSHGRLSLYGFFGSHELSYDQGKEQDLENKDPVVHEKFGITRGNGRDF